MDGHGRGHFKLASLSVFASPSDMALRHQLVVVVSVRSSLFSLPQRQAPLGSGRIRLARTGMVPVKLPVVPLQP